MALQQRDIVSRLKREHRVIKRQLGLVRRSIESPGRSSAELRESVALLRSLVDSHFVAEEKTVYAPLKLKLGRDNPVDAMALEHRAIRRNLGLLLSASTENGAGRSRFGKLQSCFDSLQKEMEDHLGKEEAVLFWLADLRL